MYTPYLSINTASYYNNSEQTNSYNKFDRTLYDIFKKYASLPGQGEIIVSGYVLPDGKGDYFHMLSMIKHLHKKFPERHIHLIANSPTVHEGLLPAPKIDRCSYQISYQAEPFQEETLQKIQKAALWISGPISIPWELNNLATVEKQKGINIHEYDEDPSTPGHAGSYNQWKNSVVMGLGTESHGIFTCNPKVFTWEMLENTQLKMLLFENAQPSQEEIETYLSLSDLFFCYMSTLNKAVKFILDAVAFTKLQEKQKSIDICFPCKGHLHNIANFLENEKANLVRQNVGCIKVIAYKGDQIKETSIPIKDNGLQIRIIDVGALTNKDFKILTQLSAPLIGCTGDNSLATALSYGKIPFYETNPHKARLAANLLRLVEEKLGEDSELYEYLSTKFNAFNAFAQFPEFSSKIIEEAKELGCYIRENRSFNSTIQGIANYHLYRLQYPHFAARIDEIRNQFVREEMTLDEAQEQVKKLVEDKANELK
jgi:hypothetical protein